MKAKRVILAVSAAFFVLVVHSTSEAVNTRDIDAVRNKPVLDNTDSPIIDLFLEEAVRELVSTRDFTSIAQARSVILTRRTSRKSSAQAQYSERFSVSAHKYISAGLKQAEQLMPKDRSFKMNLNLLILIDGLEDVRLANLAMGLLKDESKVIRYWAVHSVTSPGFTKKLNAAIAVNSQLARTIVEQLQSLLGRSGPETIALIAEFTAEVSIPQGEDLLGQIADMRIKKYADWKVDYEPLDGIILGLLYKKIFTGAVNKPAVARRFAQLYSYVIQRYVNGRDILNVAQKHKLASVLIQTEKASVSRLLGKPQTVIKRAVERNDYTRLLLEHSRILGDDTRPGELPQKLNFNYGTNQNGSARTAPLTLPNPPTELIGSARDVGKLEGKAAVERRQASISSTLHEAVRRNDINRVKSLLDEGLDVDARTQQSFTPLHIASQAGYSALAELLLAKGADVNAKSNKGFTPLYAAAQEGHTAVAKLLLAKGAGVNTRQVEGSTALHAAAGGGHQEIVEMLLAKDADVNTKGRAGCTPLYTAAEKGIARIAELLLENGAEVDERNDLGRTPLHPAAQEGHLDFAKLLLGRGANVNVKGKQSSTPLHLAAEKGQAALVELLLDKGANVNAKDLQGATPLHFAAYMGTPEVVKLLLEKGADFNAKNKNAWTPLHFAAETNKVKSAELLLAKGANVNAKDFQGATPLDFAVDLGHEAVVKLLRKHGGK